MKLKNIFCLILLLLFSANSVTVWGEKKNDNKETDYTVSDDGEIDNYDFLYADEETDLASGEMMSHIMDKAFSFLGTRYRMGSTGPASFDCSGFTSYVFGLNDYRIGRTSRDQYAKNMPITRNDLQRGDLVFFTSPRSGKGVGHVGIVVDVDPLTDTFSFIHASTNRGVTVSRSTEGYYSRRYIGARRVF